MSEPSPPPPSFSLEGGITMLWERPATSEVLQNSPLRGATGLLLVGIQLLLVEHLLLCQALCQVSHMDATMPSEDSPEKGTIVLIRQLRTPRSGELSDFPGSQNICDGSGIQF